MKRRIGCELGMIENDGFSIASRLESFRHAWRGLRTLVASQHNARIHLVATCAAIALALLMGISRLEWCAIVVAIVMVWTAEALNTALESLCDVASPEFHPLIEKSKDVAAGAVLASAIGAAVIGLLVFGPQLVRILG
jgi:diacylglycerol kinase (ATP)